MRNLLKMAKNENVLLALQFCNKLTEAPLPLKMPRLSGSGHEVCSQIHSLCNPPETDKIIILQYYHY